MSCAHTFLISLPVPYPVLSAPPRTISLSLARALSLSLNLPLPFNCPTPQVGLLPYLSGTLIGATLWGVIYTSLGAASRELLDNGMDVGDLFADLSEQASGYR